MGGPITYFGIFPSLIRMPILLLTSRFDGALTAPSMLLAWMMTALFSSLMLWRLRIVTRGRAVLGRAEAASFGLLIATIMGGSVIVYLNATPFVYNEDFAWSIPLTVGSLFALLGVMERPSWGRVWASGILILFTNLDRTPTGYACVIGAGLVGLWFVFGRGGMSNRRWGVAMLGVAFVGFAASCAVTYAKFGTPIGLPMADQVWATVNAHRRYFLAANGGKAFSFGFLPSTIVAYLQPFGIRFTTLFPYITTPTAPAAAIHAVLDQTYTTASAPPTMPLLVLLAIWGTITAFRPKALVPYRLTRHCAAHRRRRDGRRPAVGLYLRAIPRRFHAVSHRGQRYRSHRNMASFRGSVDQGQRGRAGHRGRDHGLLRVCQHGHCRGALEQFTQAQIQDFVSTEQSLSLTSLADSVHHGATLPDWAPYGQLFMVGNCSGLYFSSGITEANVPGLLAEHYTWIPVEQDPAFQRNITFTFNHPAKDFTKSVTLMTYGAARLVLEPAGTGYFRVDHPAFGNSDQMAVHRYDSKAHLRAPRAL